MISLGMLMLGAFIGYVVTYGLRHITNWQNPANVFSAVISAAVAGGIFTFIQYLGGVNLGIGLFFYPLGLAYGALCANLAWLTEPNSSRVIGSFHILGFAVASVLLVALLLSASFRALLPS